MLCCVGFAWYHRNLFSCFSGFLSSASRHFKSGPSPLFFFFYRLSLLFLFLRSARSRRHCLCFRVPPPPLPSPPPFPSAHPPAPNTLLPLLLSWLVFARLSLVGFAISARSRPSLSDAARVRVCMFELISATQNEEAFDRNCHLRFSPAPPRARDT